MALRIEGFVIVSADGMLADASGRQPDALRFEADHRFFVAGLNRAALVVHGRNSGDSGAMASKRRRIVVTRQVDAVAPDASLQNTTLWNPRGAPFDAAAARAGVTDGMIAVIGGPQVFALFFGRYDTFWLSSAARVRLPDGQGVFPGIPPRTPQQILADSGLDAGPPQMLDEAHDVIVTPWRKPQTSV